VDFGGAQFDVWAVNRENQVGLVGEFGAAQDFVGRGHADSPYSE
jgi:hypothetical protein